MFNVFYVFNVFIIHVSAAVVRLLQELVYISCENYKSSDALQGNLTCLVR